MAGQRGNGCGWRLESERRAAASVGGDRDVVRSGDRKRGDRFSRLRYRDDRNRRRSGARESQGDAAGTAVALDRAAVVGVDEVEGRRRGESQQQDDADQQPRTAATAREVHVARLTAAASRRQVNGPAAVAVVKSKHVQTASALAPDHPRDASGGHARDRPAAGARQPRRGRPARRDRDRRGRQARPRPDRGRLRGAGGQEAAAHHELRVRRGSAARRGRRRAGDPGGVGRRGGGCGRGAARGAGPAHGDRDRRPPHRARELRLRERSAAAARRPVPGPRRLGRHADHQLPSRVDAAHAGQGCHPAGDRPAEVQPAGDAARLRARR